MRSGPTPTWPPEVVELMAHQTRHLGTLIDHLGIRPEDTP